MASGSIEGDLEFVGHPFIRHMPVLVVISQDAPSILKFLGRLNCMRVVIPKNSLAIRLTQGEGVPDAMGNPQQLMNDFFADVDHALSEVKKR